MSAGPVPLPNISSGPAVSSAGLDSILDGGSTGFGDVYFSQKPKSDFVLISGIAAASLVAFLVWRR